MSNLTPEQIKAYREQARMAREKADAAPSGPWDYEIYDSHDSDNPVGDGYVYVHFMPENAKTFSLFNDPIMPSWSLCKYPIEHLPTFDFIKNARTDVPALADAVEALAAEVEYLNEGVKYSIENTNEAIKLYDLAARALLKIKAERGKRIAELEGELAELKGRTCETCAHFNSYDSLPICSRDGWAWCNCGSEYEAKPCPK